MYFNYKEILPTTFSNLEIDEIINSNAEHLTFYKFWTRKEAIVKAIGKGIDDDIIKISITDGMHSVPLNVVGDFKIISAFSFNISEDYVGALAMADDLHDFDKIVFCPLPTSNEWLSLI